MATITAQMDAATAQSYGLTTKTVYDTNTMKTIRECVNLLVAVDSLPGLARELDEVPKLQEVRPLLLHTWGRTV